MKMNRTDGIWQLLQPLGGLLAPKALYRAHGDEPMLTTRMFQCGDISCLTGPAFDRPKLRDGTIVSGAGVGLDDDEANLPALSEALERYCTGTFAEDQFVWATAQELGSEALDLDSIPRCSTAELAHPKCPLLAPDKKTPIRWVRGVSLLDGKATWLPAVMVYLYISATSPGERFWVQITTGCAAHVSLERALTSAILEILERDALSILWLQQLPLPRIVFDSLDARAAPYWEKYERSSDDIEYFFFDATTDLCVPTVYGIQVSRADRLRTTLVSCSTAVDPVDALLKVLREMAACRVAHRHPRSFPRDWDDFEDLFHGAAFMARAEQAQAFGFLLRSGRTTKLSGMKRFGSGNERDTLRHLLQLLRCNGFDVYAVDLSTDEAIRSGISVVRAIVPGLQPFSYRYRARYLGHPRLYSAPNRMGYQVRAEAQLNSWPVPFA